jgi:hypothetical protein
MINAAETCSANSRAVPNIAPMRSAYFAAYCGLLVGWGDVTSVLCGAVDADDVSAHVGHVERCQR